MRTSGGVGRKAVLGIGAAVVLLLSVFAISRSVTSGSAAPAGADSGADARPAAAGGSPDAPTEAPPAAQDAAADAIPYVEPPKARNVMADPFRNGRLPGALPAVRGNADAAAATLAAFVAARDDQSVPALITAITSAGFGVRHSDGRLEQTVRPGQGLAFDDWELAAMAKLYGERKAIRWTTFADDLKRIPALAPLPLERLLLDGIVRHAGGGHPQLRFWARLIVELGRRADEPYDLLASADPAAVHLDPVQAALILRRLFGDFAAAGQSASHTPAPPVRHASLAGDAAPSLVRLAAAVQDPCSEMGKGDTSTILDAGAVVTSTGWGAVLDAIGEAGEKYAKFLTVGNTLLAYAKLLMTYASIDSDIAMASPPLVRTTNAAAGERRQLTATVTMDSGGFDKYNCVRTALNVATGIDFSLVGDGPLEDVELTWRVDNPGEPFYSNRTGITGNRPIVGITTGGPRIQDAGTSAGPVGAGTVIGDPTRSKTDANGRARIYLEGTPRIPYLPRPHMPVMKEAVVRTNLKLKGGDIKGDAVDIAGQALGGVGAIASLPVELLFRIPWASVGHYTAAIRDWETCTSDEWYGTITATTTFERSSVEHPTADAVKKHEAKYRHDAVINVAGDTATGTITTEELVASDQSSGYGRITSRRVASARYSGEVSFDVSMNVATESYGVGIERPELTGTSLTTGSCERPAPYKCQQPSPSSRPWSGDSRYLLSMSGRIDPKDPTVISDTQTFGRDSGLTHTLRVNLRRCQ